MVQDFSHQQYYHHRLCQVTLAVFEASLLLGLHRPRFHFCLLKQGIQQCPVKTYRPEKTNLYTQNTLIRHHIMLWSWWSLPICWWPHLPLILLHIWIHLGRLHFFEDNIYYRNWETTHAVLPATGVRGPWGGLCSGAFASCFFISGLSLFQPWSGTSRNHLSEARSVEWSMTLPWLSGHW